MLDLNDPNKTRTIRAFDPDERYGAVPGEEEEQEGDPLDSSENTELHSRLIAYYQEELDRQSWNREQMAIDQDFYDNIQWSEQDAAALRERGQAPMVFNIIAQSLNWVMGSEKRGRTDFRVLPRRKEDSAAASRKTQLLKYLSDANDSPFATSRAFEDAAIVGIGWLECGQQDDDDGEPVYDRYESWRNMLWDSASTNMDLTDARYVFRSKWVDTDIATALFPTRRAMIEHAAGDAMRVGGTRQFGDDAMDSQETERIYTGGIIGATSGRTRVRLIEGWFMLPKQVQRLRGGDFHGEIYDPEDQRHQEQVAIGQATLVTKMAMRMHCCIMTTAGLLYFGESPYRHNRFPFTPIWAYRRGRDGMPYGIVRGLRDIQEDINKRFSKALYILSSNKTIMDEGAVSDMDEFLKEVARPDGVIQKKKGYELVINADRELAPAHLELMGRSISMVQQVSGITDELMGRTTNATSGVAIANRQNQGQLSTSKLFDNLRLASKVHGEKKLSLVEQFFTEQKQFRITNQRGTPEYITINDGLPENDIARTKADFVISEADWRATMRQAATDQMVDLLSKMPPQVAMVLLDLLVESMDIDNREEIVRRIRAINGQRDPDQSEPTPEDIQRMQAEQEAAQFQKQMALAQLRELVSKAAKNEADAQRIMAQAGLAEAQTVGTNVTAEQNAINAAQLALIPGIAPTADILLREAGFVPAPEKAAQVQIAAAIQAQAQREQLAQQQQAAAAAQQQQQPQQPQQPQPMPADPAAAPTNQQGIPQ